MASASCATACRVDAAGVPAEWVETTPATEGQPTLVLFVDRASEPDPLASSRQRAARLAATSLARVLTVACQNGPDTGHAGSVKRAIAAYSWLLSEGCNPETTTFLCDSTDASLLHAILEAAVAAALPPPRHSEPHVTPPRPRHSLCRADLPSAS